MDADHCSETTRRRSGDGYKGRGCSSVEKHKLFVGFLPVHRMGLGAGGGGAGAGLTEVASCRGRDCSTLAAAAVGSRQCGRSQTVSSFYL